MKIKTIKKKYDALENKMDFLFKAAERVNLNFFTIKNHHFGGKWNIPEKYHEPYLEELDRALKKQKGVLKGIFKKKNKV